MATITKHGRLYTAELRATISGWRVTFRLNSDGSTLREYRGIKANHADEAYRKAQRLILEAI